MNFPDCEDYEPGCSPVRELSLARQVQYWKSRARFFETGFHELAAQREPECDEADWWKHG